MDRPFFLRCSLGWRDFSAPALLLAWLAAGCATRDGGRTPAATPPPTGERTFTLLAINDVYRLEGVDEGKAGGLARVRTLRAELERDAPDLLLLHAGDALFPSLPSRLYAGAQMIDVLSRLDGDAQAFDERMFFTLGNHEFEQDKLAQAANLDQRLAESQFTWLGSNVFFTGDEVGRPLVAGDNLAPSAVVSSGGVRVGLFSLTTDMKHPAYVEWFRNPLMVAREMTAQLRAEGAEVVVALTHLSIGQDAEILQRLGADGPDLIIGGHEHEKQFQDVGGRLVLKADADARTATVARVTLRAGAPPRVEHVFRSLDATVAEDPEVAAAVADWLARTDRDYCARQRPQEPPDCLDEQLSRAGTELVGEELEIRRFETNFGDWIADQALAALRPYGAQAAFVNAGNLRLNQNVPAGSAITRRHLEELFAYPTPIQLIRIDGATLQQVVDHAVTGWTGSGKWLQIAGFAFAHDPAAEQATHLTLLASDGPRPIAPDEELLVAATGYLLDITQDQDGYTMLGPAQVVPAGASDPDLKDVVRAALKAAGDAGIAPEVAGRICNPQRPGPCLAVTAPAGE